MKTAQFPYCLKRQLEKGENVNNLESSLVGWYYDTLWHSVVPRAAVSSNSNLLRRDCP